jgi:hypothetical protein
MIQRQLLDETYLDDFLIFGMAQLDVFFLGLACFGYLSAPSFLLPDFLAP